MGKRLLLNKNVEYISLKSLLLGALLISVLYLTFYEILSSHIMTYVEITLWIIAILWSVTAYVKGFDVGKLIYSFSWSFITVISTLYIVFVLLLRIPWLPKALALFLAVPTFEAYLGHAILKIKALKERKTVVKIKLNIVKKIRSSLFKLDKILITFMLISSLILIIFLIMPLLMMLIHAFNVPEGYPPYHWFNEIFSSKRYVRTPLPIERAWYPIQLRDMKIIRITGLNYGVLVNSLINSAIVTSVATILGIIVAFVLARYRFPGKTFIRILAIIPLFVTPFINAYAIKNIFSAHGPLSWITLRLFGFGIEIDKLAGVALAQIMAFYPIVYLNAYSSFMNIDPSTEEQAENLGAKGLKLFFTVTLPLALPGIAAGSVIVFIFSLEDLGAPIVFQERNLISYQIFSSLVGETGMVTPEIAALGFILLGLAVAGFIAVRSYVGMRAYAMVSRGGRWSSRERPLGWKGYLVVYLLLLPLIFFTALPQITVVLMAFNIIPPYGYFIQLDKATLEYFTGIFTMPDIARYIRNTITYATMATALALLVSILATYAINRAKIKFVTSALDTLMTIPLAIPGLVIALGYYYFYSTFFRGTVLDPAAGTAFQVWIVLVIAYSIRKLPFVARSIYAGFQQVHEALEEAALNLGAKRLRVLATIALPLIILNIASGALIGFIYISTEVSTSVTLGSLNVAQAPMTQFMMQIYKGGTAEGVQYVASMGVLLILMQLLAVSIITLVFKQRYAFIGA